jgi:subtilisin family serine protease
MVGFTNIAPSNFVPTSFSIAGVGDSNSDGVKDIFWRNDTTGATAYWQMNAGYQSVAYGSFFSPTALGPVVEQVGDVNNDNRPDLVWKMPDGSYYAWVLGAGNNAMPAILSPPRVPGNSVSTTNNFINSNFHSEFGYGMVDVSAAIALLRGQAQPLEQVDVVPPNTISHNIATDNDRQNEILNLPEVWNQQYTGQGVTVAVIDSGVMQGHPDLNDNIWLNVGEIANDGIDNDNNGFIDDRVGWDFFDNDSSPVPNLSEVQANHGTLVAGMIAAENTVNLGQSITGGAFNSRIMTLRASDDSGRVDAGTVQAIRYAANMGARVINLSFADSITNYTNQQIADITNAVNYAVNRNAVVVISAGNGSTDTIDNRMPAFLAGTPGVIAVGATSAGTIALGSSSYNDASRVASFSTGAGNTVRNYVVAPGRQVQTTTIDSNGNANYAIVGGTSFSAPLVAAAVAVIRQAVPWATPAQITNALTQTSDPSDIYI